MSWLHTDSGSVNPEWLKKISRKQMDTSLAHFSQQDRDMIWELTHPQRDEKPKKEKK